MKWASTLSMILGAQWFLPISCTAALYTGTHINAYLDTREVALGETIHPGFSIAIEPGENDNTFQLIPLSDIARRRSSDEETTLTKPSAHIKLDDQAYASYRVLENHNGTQIIEVEHGDSDKVIWSRYRATKTGVTPLASRMFHHGYMFGALPYAFSIALLVYCTGRFLRRKISIDRGTTKIS